MAIQYYRIRPYLPGHFTIHPIIKKSAFFTWDKLETIDFKGGLYCRLNILPDSYTELINVKASQKDETISYAIISDLISLKFAKILETFQVNVHL